MSDGEYKIADVRGKFMQAVRDGRKLTDADWQTGRIVLSNRRLVLAGNDGRRTIPLASIRHLDGRHDVNQAVARVSGYVSLRFDDDVVLVAASDHDEFETAVYRALLDGRVLLAKHPAVAGGVVRDSKWEKARLKVGDGTVNLALERGAFVPLELADVGTVSVAERTVGGEKKPVVEVEHTEEGTSVQTHLSGSERRCAILESLLRADENRRTGELELSQSEREVLMALYTGVSPFEIPGFLGVEVDEIEEIFERLAELEVVDVVRVRREVALRPRGRNIASEAMNDQ
ncbi:CheF family chemotaxis protein [Halegenticoccus tardaugens]|uniref:CheF family chemotaxis protein n=1 Tax=Halegenticoccus tardaugens TaxID=2071624 RepID=UPI00100AD316|nr:CheF family chemotaxis protein [Halegenticoccus tardaugens]